MMSEEQLTVKVKNAQRKWLQEHPKVKEKDEEAQEVLFREYMIAKLTEICLEAERRSPDADPHHHWLKECNVEGKTDDFIKWLREIRFWPPKK